MLDDEILGLSYLKLIVEQIQDIEIVKAYNDPQIFLDESKKLDFDFCVFDIEMPKISGLEVAKLIQNKPIIFTTAYRDYALEAFEVNAVDYIQKPVQKNRLEQAIGKVKVALIGQQKKQQQKIQFNTSSGKSLVNIESIVYITISKIDSRDKEIYFDDNTKLILKNYSFEKLKSLLPLNYFCRINKKDLISIQFVESFTSEEVKLKNLPLKFPISDIFKMDFIRLI